MIKAAEYHTIWEKRKTEEKRKRNLAIEKAKGVARALKKKYRVREVILFESLARFD